MEGKDDAVVPVEPAPRTGQSAQALKEVQTLREGDLEELAHRQQKCWIRVRHWVAMCVVLGSVGAVAVMVGIWLWHEVTVIGWLDDEAVQKLERILFRLAEWVGVVAVWHDPTRRIRRWGTGLDG